LRRDAAVEHDFAAARAVEQRIHHELNRFCSRVQCEQVVALARLDGSAVIALRIAAVPSIFSEFDIVGMPAHARLVDKDQLVLGAIESPRKTAPNN
jgi:hypothetical protein